MATGRLTTRLQVGSAAWVAEERSSAMQIADTEVEEFTFSARNELDWLNEHMAEIFNENQMNVTEMFKTPGKLRGKTPRTARKRNPLEVRAPLSDIFSASPRQNGSPLRQVYNERQSPRFKVAEDAAVSPPKFAIPQKPEPAQRSNNLFQDSGYHGSQSTQAASMMYESQEATLPFSQPWSPSKTPAKANIQSLDAQSEERRTTEGSYQSAKEEQTVQMALEKTAVDSIPAPMPAQPVETNVLSPEQTLAHPPTTHVPMSPEMVVPAQLEKDLPALPETELKEAEAYDEAATPSDGSSPVRPIVRKSSLNFAALPAREPLTTKKSIGNSRPSHLEQNRTSYYGRGNDDRGFGNQAEDDADKDEMDTAEPAAEPASKAAQANSKTYTQRLQDQISMLGQSKPNAPRPSKSIPNIAAMASQSTYAAQQQETSRAPASPSRTDRAFNAPGAFPEDEDSWIGPPNTTVQSSLFSPRPALTKSNTTEVMEGIRGKESIGGHEFNLPKQRDVRQPSPLREVAQHRPNGIFGHSKSQSTSIIQSPYKMQDYNELKKTISVSNPNPGGQDEQNQQSPSKSPERSYRDSPLKAAKDKLSSILKTSKGLFASSAAASAGAMASTISPAPGRINYQASQSMADLMGSTKAPSIYPSLKTQPSSQSLIPESPSKKASMRKAKEKEVRDAEVMVQQLNKLDREREREAEKARLFTQQERERVAAMERKVAAQKEQERRAAAQKEEEKRLAAQKEEERRLAAQKEEERRVAAQKEQEKLAAMQKEEERKALAREAPAPPKPTRTSPRKTKAQLEAEGRAAAAAAAESADENVEMTDSTSTAPQSLSRSQIGKPKDPVKRPLRPTAKQPATNARGAPVVIRVNTGSRPFQPSNAALAASLGDSLPPVAPQSVAGPSRAKQPVKTLHSKASVDSLKSVASTTTTKVKALEAAARKREQDEREAQRKRDAKVELANQLDAKRNAQRALEKKQELERAKQNRPPPPPARPNPNAEREKPLPAVHRAEPEPVHRMNPTRPQEENRMNTLQNTTKAPPKRPMPADESQSRPTMQRNGPSYQQTDSKRRKTEDEFMDDAMETQPRGAMAPPIRQSAIRQKDVPMKSLFPTGYSNAPSHNAVHNAPHAIPQHMQSKPTRPTDMTQTSKAPINFAPNPAHKTPARPLGPSNPNGKSTSKPSAKSSPRYMNGENIDLPEINTDSEDDDSDAGDFAVPDWANSPNLAAGIMAQEGCDPATVFGPPSELRMEEVFRNKERWGKFRQRTSSANWSGTDRLTEEEIQRDLVARERLRRDGGWTYGMS